MRHLGADCHGWSLAAPTFPAWPSGRGRDRDRIPRRPERDQSPESPAVIAAVTWPLVRSLDVVVFRPLTRDHGHAAGVSAIDVIVARCRWLARLLVDTMWRYTDRSGCSVLIEYAVYAVMCLRPSTESLDCGACEVVSPAVIARGRLRRAVNIGKVSGKDGEMSTSSMACQADADCVGGRADADGVRESCRRRPRPHGQHAARSDGYKAARCPKPSSWAASLATVRAKGRQPNLDAFRRFAAIDRHSPLAESSRARSPRTPNDAVEAQKT